MGTTSPPSTSVIINLRTTLPSSPSYHSAHYAANSTTERSLLGQADLAQEEQPRPGRVMLVPWCSCALMGSTMVVVGCYCALILLCAGVWVGSEAAVAQCMPVFLVYVYPAFFAIAQMVSRRAECMWMALYIGGAAGLYGFTRPVATASLVSMVSTMLRVCGASIWLWVCANALLVNAIFRSCCASIWIWVCANPVLVARFGLGVTYIGGNSKCLCMLSH